MSRAVVALHDQATRQRVARWAMNAPSGTRVEFREPKRSGEQNSRMWAMLTDVSKQVKHQGRVYAPEDWKCLFMHALGREVRFLPALDGQSFVPLGYRSSELSKAEMTELMDLMEAWGAEHGVTFHDNHTMTAAARTTRLSATPSPPPSNRPAKPGSGRG